MKVQGSNFSTNKKFLLVYAPISAVELIQLWHAEPFPILAHVFSAEFLIKFQLLS